MLFLFAWASVLGVGLRSPRHTCFKPVASSSKGLASFGFALIWRAFAPTAQTQVVKNAASSVKNLCAYESNVLSRVLIEQARQVRVDIADGLVGPEEDIASLFFPIPPIFNYIFPVFFEKTVKGLLWRAGRQAGAVPGGATRPR